jgi:hypothetical protein
VSVGLARGARRGRATGRGRAIARHRARDLPRRSFTYQLEVAGIGEPFKAEVTSEGQAVLLPLGSEIGLNWHPSACVLLEREEQA